MRIPGLRILIPSIAAAMIIGAQQEARSTSTGIPDPEPTRWTIDIPHDGIGINRVIAYLGEGVASETGTLSSFHRTQVNPAGVFASDLTLLFSTTVTTHDSDTWVHGPDGGETGHMVATIVPSSFTQGSETNTPFVVGPGGPTEDIRNIVGAMRGDATTFSINPTPTPPPPPAP